MCIYITLHNSRLYTGVIKKESQSIQFQEIVEVNSMKNIGGVSIR